MVASKSSNGSTPRWVFLACIPILLALFVGVYSLAGSAYVDAGASKRAVESLQVQVIELREAVHKGDVTRAEMLANQRHILKAINENGGG